MNQLSDMTGLCPRQPKNCVTWQRRVFITVLFSQTFLVFWTSETNLASVTIAKKNPLGNTLLEYFRKASMSIVTETKTIYCATKENCHFVMSIEINPSWQRFSKGGDKNTIERLPVWSCVVPHASQPAVISQTVRANTSTWRRWHLWCGVKRWACPSAGKGGWPSERRSYGGGRSDEGYLCCGSCRRSGLKVMALPRLIRVASLLALLAQGKTRLTENTWANQVRDVAVAAMWDAAAATAALN